MTLIEVIDAARVLANEPLASSRTFPDNSSGFWQDSQLIENVNMVQQEIAQEIVQSFEDYFVTSTDLGISADQAAYTLPTNFFKARRVEDRRSDNPLEILPSTMNAAAPYAGDPLFRTVSSTNWRGGYFLRGNSIVFEETPTFTNDSSIRLYYVKVLDDICAASTISEIPLPHHRVLVWGLVKHMMASQEADMTQANNEYLRMLNTMKKEVENRQVQRPRSVKRSRSRWRR